MAVEPGHAVAGELPHAERALLPPRRLGQLLRRGGAEGGAEPHTGGVLPVRREAEAERQPPRSGVHRRGDAAGGGGVRRRVGRAGRLRPPPRPQPYPQN